MSKDDDHTFPPAWGWERYELAFAELMTRLAQTQEEATPNGRFRTDGFGLSSSDYEGLKLQNWWDEQVREGRLPPDSLLLSLGGDQGRKLDDIFDGNLAAARMRNRSRRVLDADLNHGRRFNPPTGKLAPSNGNQDEGFGRFNRGRRR